MKQQLLAVGIWGGAALFVAGCARIDDRALHLFSTKVEAVLIANGHLLQGDLVMLPDRTGKLTVTADTAQVPTQSCSGQMRYTATLSGVIDVRCNDGTAAELRFSLLSETQGYAYGQTGTPPMSLAFGMSALQAKAYLMIPAGKRLEINEDDRLEMR